MSVIYYNNYMKDLIKMLPEVMEKGVHRLNKKTGNHELYYDYVIVEIAQMKDNDGNPRNYVKDAFETKLTKEKFLAEFSAE